MELFYMVGLVMIAMGISLVILSGFLYGVLSLLTWIFDKIYGEQK